MGFGEKHGGALGHLAEGAFVLGASTKPRKTAKVMFVLGLLAGGFCSFLAVTNHEPRWFVVGAYAVGFGLVLAIIARIIGWFAGMGLEAAQDVIHDRYQPGHDVGESFRYDPYTGKRLVWRYDPYSGEPLD